MRTTAYTQTGVTLPLHIGWWCWRSSKIGLDTTYVISYA